MAEGQCFQRNVVNRLHPKWQRRVCADPTIVVRMDKTQDTVRCFG